MGAGLDRWIQEASYLQEADIFSSKVCPQIKYLLALPMETCWILNGIGLNLYHTHLHTMAAPFPSHLKSCFNVH